MRLEAMATGNKKLSVTRGTVLPCYSAFFTASPFKKHTPLPGLPALDALRIARALKEYSTAGAEFVPCRVRDASGVRHRAFATDGPVWTVWRLATPRCWPGSSPSKRIWGDHFGRPKEPRRVLQQCTCRGWCLVPSSEWR